MIERLYPLLFASLFYFSISWGQGELKLTCTDSDSLDIQESIAFYQDRLSMDSTDQISYYSIGMGYFKLGKYSSAIRYFDKLEDLNPEYPALYSNRGICKLFIDNLSGACNDLSLCLFRGEDPEIIDGEKISNWIAKNCPASHGFLAETLCEGRKCPDFSYPGYNTPSISLSELRGKYVVIDLWATWCTPCIIQRSKFEALKSKYARYPEIEIISISLDKELETWQRYVASDKFRDKQFWAGSSQDETAFRLTLSQGTNGRILMGIPQYVIVDPDGIIIKKFHGNIHDVKKELKAIRNRI